MTSTEDLETGFKTGSLPGIQRLHRSGK